jgi:mannose-1-phosphate guanylyltransferase/mannose-6-phosphate isomerase
MATKPDIYPVIMAGGSGTRFWPLSRHLFPKQLLKIIGDETLIQQTMRRVVHGTDAGRVMISTNPAQADSIRVQLGEWKDAIKDNFVLEPEGRNTAPAIALVALELTRRNPDAVMLVVPADHIVKGQREFDAAVALAADLAGQGYLVTFGVKPIRPETGYGYIKPDKKSTLAKSGKLKGHPVSRFVEKPNMAKALQYLKAGDFYWNSGMFVWRAATILDEIKRHQPKLYQGIERIRQLLHGGASKQAIDDEYRKLDAISIDNGVMEKSSKAAVVPVSFRWSDVGSWGSLDEVAPKLHCVRRPKSRGHDRPQRHGGGGYAGRDVGVPEVARPGRQEDRRRTQASECAGASGAFDRPSAVGLLYRFGGGAWVQGETRDGEAGWPPVAADAPSTE